MSRQNVQLWPRKISPFQVSLVGDEDLPGLFNDPNLENPSTQRRVMAIIDEPGRPPATEAATDIVPVFF